MWGLFRNNITMPKILIAQNKFQVMLKNILTIFKYLFKKIFDEKACLCDIYPDESVSHGITLYV